MNFLDFRDLYGDSKTGVLDRLTDNLYMMHVRAATKGAINKDNAHPYEFDDFIAAHNGTLKDKKYDHEEKTDSFLFFKAFQEKLEQDKESNFDEMLADHINTLETGGAYAITMLNKYNRCMYFLRNNARPLFVAINRKRSVIYWASERWMLSGVLGRYGLKSAEDDETKNDIAIFHFQENFVHRLDLNAIKAGEEKLFNKTDILARRPLPEVSDDYSDEYGGLPWAGWWRSEQAYKETEKKGQKKEQEQKVSVPLVRLKDKPVFNVKCIVCQKEMNLVDMHEGTCIDDANHLYECEECTEYDVQSFKNVHIN